jgi:hypothetical protein
LLLFVAHPFLAPERWKPASEPLLAQADAVVINVPVAEKRAPAAEVVKRLRAARGRDDLIVADVTRPLDQWAPHLAGRLRSRGGSLAGVGSHA